MGEQYARTVKESGTISPYPLYSRVLVESITTLNNRLRKMKLFEKCRSF